MLFVKRIFQSTTRKAGMLVQHLSPMFVFFFVLQEPPEATKPSLLSKGLYISSGDLLNHYFVEGVE